MHERRFRACVGIDLVDRALVTRPAAVDRGAVVHFIFRIQRQARELEAGVRVAATYAMEGMQYRVIAARHVYLENRAQVGTTAKARRFEEKEVGVA